MSLYSIWPILSPPHSFNMKEQILNTTPVQGHCSISLCIANPLPAAPRCRLLWRGAAPLPQALCPAESFKLTVQAHDPQVHTPELTLLDWKLTFVAAALIQPFCTPEWQHQQKPCAVVFFPVNRGRGAVGTTPEAAPHARGAWERRHVGFPFKNNQSFVYYTHPDSGTPLVFFFFPFTRINSLKPSHYSICCTAHSDSCLPTWDFQQASKTCFWMPRTWRTNHTNTNNLMLLQSNQY